MENILGSIFSGFAQVVGKLFGHPLDFLAGKSCNTVCGPTWDFTCYIENFCIAHLLKLAMVFVLFYFVLLFFYLLYKLGICHCICHITCGIIWACFASFFYVLHCCCTFLCSKLQKHNQRRRKQDIDIEELAFSSEEDSEGSFSLQPTSPAEHRRRSLSRRREYKREHLRKSLRPRSHRIHVGISENSMNVNKRNSTQDHDHDHVSPIHHIRVTKTSKFAQKRPHNKGSIHRRQRL